MSKKVIIFLIFGLLLISVFIFWLLQPSIFKNQKKTNQQPQASSPQKILINTLPVSERPYVILEPKSSVEPKSLGHWVTMTIVDAKDFEKLEYEFEYTAGSMIQGGMGRIDFRQEPAPVSKEIAFGSASKGKYKYDEGVESGSFTFHFYKGGEEAVLKTDFKLQNKSQNGGIFTPPNEEIKLKTGKNDLEKSDFVLVASTLGLPRLPEGEIIAGPYGFYADSPKRLTDSILTSEKEGYWFWWDGKKWQEQKEGKIQALGTFVLVAKETE